MVDQVSPERRSAIMARISGKNTGPEMRVRKLAHAMGLRFRIHRSDLPGKPDVVFPKRRIVLFIHGCFWHQHEGCRRASMPKSRQEYWSRKLLRNIERDAANQQELIDAGWQVAVIWECETNSPEELAKIISTRIGR